MKSRLRKNEVERTHRFLAENVAHTITKNANKSHHDCHSGLADGLLAQGLTPLLLGGPADLTAAQRIAASHAGILNLVGQFRCPSQIGIADDIRVRVRCKLLRLMSSFQHLQSLGQQTALSLPVTELLFESCECSLLLFQRFLASLCSCRCSFP